MAKEKKEKEPKEAEQSTNDEVQIPEKPKKKYSDLGLKSVIMIVAGSLVVVILLIFALYWFLIRPDILASGGNSKGNTQPSKIQVVMDEETIKFNEELAKIKQEAKLGILKDLSFFQTQDIITNTNPPDWYVVLQIGIEYKEVLAAEGGGGHGAGGATLSPKLNSEISSVVTKFCGNKNIESIINQRSTLDSVLLNELYPIFIKDKVYLHKISIPKFVTQRA